jgi:hypothetical protein
MYVTAEMCKKDDNSDLHEGNTREEGQGRVSHLDDPNPPELTVRIIFYSHLF